MKPFKFPKEASGLIQNALPRDVAIYGTPPNVREMFTPSGHSRALHPDAVLIVGIRGAGKSFWWTVLQNPDHRRMVAHLLPRAGINESTVITPGFGERSSPDDYPGKDTLVSLCRTIDPRQVWRTVVLRHAVRSAGLETPFSQGNWPDAVDWVHRHPESVEHLLYQADQHLDNNGKNHLILFDALDRTADDWPAMQTIIRGLLQVLLEFRACRRIRPKAFLRPDHLEDANVANFTDASKILSQKVELRWPRNELYGLLWQYLANDPLEGSLFREGCQEMIGVSWQEYGDVWAIPEDLRMNEEVQRTIFHAITGPWMGRDRRRGFPYTWLPNHLGDADGQVSPRSFLAAIRYAASDTPKADYPYPLYYENIKRGVREASRIRVREMQEDYPWVEMLMKPLASLNVPCRFEEIERRWEQAQALHHLREEVAGATVKLPPVHLEAGAEGVRRDLEALGILERMTDGRTNMPDVYRIGYGLGRKGGIKAVARK